MALIKENPYSRFLILALVFAFPLTFVMAMSMIIPAIFFTITRRIFIVIPVFLNKIDWSSTRIVFTTVFAPIFLVAYWHMQVEWLIYHPDWNRLDDYGCWID